MASVIFLSAVGLVILIFYIYWAFLLNKKFNREIEYLNALIEKLLKGGDQDE